MVAIVVESMVVNILCKLDNTSVVLISVRQVTRIGAAVEDMMR